MSARLCSVEPSTTKFTFKKCDAGALKETTVADDDERAWIINPNGLHSEFSRLDKGEN